ncbi:hypothetical protein [Candidatus Galacturonibacter soehngenii]|uniref:hypothetical protein n=1 Tax=Candidatus Galacturonatibacter soehngenii TaxID=2307010 RepID=UPI00178108F2|nr:hypothetical protein [Candidatus Galacturonibacter soehngenii]
MTKTNVLFSVKKCLSCGTYHSLEKHNCSCGGYLYFCGDIYQPKVRKKQYH